MDSITELTDKLTELRDELQYGKLPVDAALAGLEKTRDALSSITVPGSKSNNIMRSFLVNFNVSNMAEATILIRYRDGKHHVIEHSGAAPYTDHLAEMLEEDPYFYRNTDRLEIRGRQQKIYFESMTTEKASYTLLTMSESAFFRPSRFHMLSDIMMDIIRSGDVIFRPLYNDLFEDVVVDISGFIALEKNSISQVILFRFEYITDIIENIGIVSLIGLSDSIRDRLNDLFKEEASIFRISLARFLIFFRNVKNGYDNFLEYQKRGKLDFSYRGIVLPHHHFKISHTENDTVYDLFENIFKAQDNMAGRDVNI
ncbi:MAG TPA: hypothetical protein PK514_05840 [Spirochaetota bacterium]|nr:hypothetical protein [Spirochaetota bacterium]